ncbi:hypothetical protein IKP94_03870 [Candidatus Saccharibacteria bacterium]|nr:hypothetical protein [Candidatus Saccharibacteria bacterium]
MNKRISAAVMATIFALTSANFSYARILDEDELGLVSQTCSSIVLQLKNIQKTDAKNRAKLGSYYEMINSNLMLNLNLRLVKNNMANANLSELQTTFSSERDYFKTAYTSYQKALDSLIAIDCREKPQEFYDQLEKVRTKREKVNSSAGRLLGIIEEHREEVINLRKGL